MSPLWFTSVAFATPIQIAAQGCDALDHLGMVGFTFVVEAEGERKVERQWRYYPRSGEVERTIDGQTLRFRYGAPDNEEQTRADAQFINDSFWLMPQCHVSWAADLNVEDHGSRPLPVGDGTARKVTVVYPADGGGYTPGDAYDLYLDASSRLVAWTYRRSNGPDPTLSTTFSDYVALGPLMVATDHVAADGFRVILVDLTSSK